jgi:hypothetical protein
MDIIGRAKNICITPVTEWSVIAAEDTPTAALITGYVLPLAAVSALAGFIGRSLVGYSMPFVGSYRVPLVTGLGMAVVALVMAVVACVLVAMVVNALAPSFGAQKDSTQALKVVAYSYTPAWLAGVLQILPMLGVLSVLAALYGIYLLYLGLPKLMKCPEDKSVGYTAVVVVCTILLSVALGAISAGMFAAGALGGGLAGGGAAPAAQADPDSIAGRLQQFGQQMEQSAARAEEAGRRGDMEGQVGAAMEGIGAILGGGRRVEALEVEQLRAFAPETFGGLARTASRAERSGVAGVMVTTVAATYGDGTREVDLEIVDSGGMSGLAGLASTFGVQGEREDASGSERTYRQDGRLVRERVSKTGGTNEFGLLVGNRFTVTVTSTSLDLNALKAATAALDLAQLEAMRDAGVQP